MNHYHEDRPSAWKCTCDAATRWPRNVWDLENECAISGDCWDRRTTRTTRSPRSSAA